MTVRPSIPVGIQPGTKVLRLERNPKHSRLSYQGKRISFYEEGSWCLWINTHDYQSGTYLKLYDDGMIERVTLFADGCEEVQLVKPRDKE
jgi:hypothetical protein